MFLDAAHHFIHLDLYHIVYLFVVGFIGGLVSGFIGSGGAFVLTPAMMSMGVPGVVAVASNICHKFPKALVGAIKRAKYGQVDLRQRVHVVSVTRPGHSDERKREANQVVRRAVAHLQKEGIEATGAVPHGLPDVEIVEAARRINADLIIMGSHGRTGLERILLGSTSERVINDAPCAILIVKAG